MSKLIIGQAELTHGLFLAPMAGVTDRAFREICREKGAEFLTGEMVSAKALCFEQNKRKKSDILSRTAPLADVSREELPMAVQLFGNDPAYMAEAAALLESGEYLGCAGTARPTAIDINMGCPVHKIVGNGEGSALMRDPALAARIVRTVVDRISLPVTVKIRAGWDADSINAPEFAKAMADAGAALVAVHARTRAQMYAPSADIRIIEAVKHAVSIPVVGNGDITSAADALAMFARTGCDGVMIGRGALGNPWLFEEITYALAGKEPPAPPTHAERIAAALAHLDRMLAYKGEGAAIEAKKHMGWYLKGLPGAATLRDAINRAETGEEIKALLRRI